MCVGGQHRERVEAALQKEGISLSPESVRTSGSSLEGDMLVDPMLFRAVDDLVRAETDGQGSLQVVQLNVQQEGNTYTHTSISMYLYI